MKNILSITFLLFAMYAQSQIVLEHTYDSASAYSGGSNPGNNQLMIVKFEISGERYVIINRWDKTIYIYDLNHSLLKTISCVGFPTDPSGGMGTILYLSQSLFNIDSKIEFLYTYDGGGSNIYTGIYNEDGTLLFSEVAAPLILVNYPLQQYPIYNTSQGTKMILSYNNYPSSQAKVFGLPGTLSAGIQEANQQLMQGISNPYPNPTNNSTRIDYKLPNGINEGEIVFYDLQGKEIKRFKVDRTFDSLLISTADIQAGTYFYQLQIASQASEGKKMVVVK